MEAENIAHVLESAKYSDDFGDIKCAFVSFMDEFVDKQLPDISSKLPGFVRKVVEESGYDI